MPMPSLFKYFAFVGACLLALLSLVNFLLDPSTGATTVAPPKPTVAIQHDPRASKIERWRIEHLLHEPPAVRIDVTGRPIALHSSLSFEHDRGLLQLQCIEVGREEHALRRRGGGMRLERESIRRKHCTP